MPKKGYVSIGQLCAVHVRMLQPYNRKKPTNHYYLCDLSLMEVLLRIPHYHGGLQIQFELQAWIMSSTAPVGTFKQNHTPSSTGPEYQSAATVLASLEEQRSAVDNKTPQICPQPAKPDAAPSASPASSVTPDGDPLQALPEPPKTPDLSTQCPENRDKSIAQYHSANAEFFSSWVRIYSLLISAFSTIALVDSPHDEQYGYFLPRCRSTMLSLRYFAERHSLMALHSSELSSCSDLGAPCEAQIIGLWQSLYRELKLCDCC